MRLGHDACAQVLYHRHVGSDALSDEAIFDKFFKESVISLTSNNYRLDASMSYVLAETKATDPAFWNKK